MNIKNNFFSRVCQKIEIKYYLKLMFTTAKNKKNINKSK